MSAATLLRRSPKVVLMPKERARKKAESKLLARIEPQRCEKTLSKEQKAILDMVVNEGRSMFFTGAAGSGKSLLLREIIRQLRAKHDPGSVAVTASTGISATNIGGTTLHAWASLSPRIRSSSDLMRVLVSNYPCRMRWYKTKVLVIDEISMVDEKLFDIIARTARKIRGNQNPFGGIQIVCAGDFFQLPPVPENNETTFAFESKEWKQCITESVALSEVFRQKDSKFVNILNALREGILTPEANDILGSLDRPLPPHPSGIIATELFPTRREVAAANAARLEALPETSPLHIFTARDGGVDPIERKERLLAKMIVGPTVALKKDAQVMMLRNFDDVLVNGSIGRVLGFYAANEVKGDSLLKSAIPGRALSGSVRNVIMQEDGQTPVTPSFVPRNNTDEKLPLVEFAMPDLKAEREYVLVGRETFQTDNPEGTATLATRSQIPLTLAWAMSIHKSQGQTLPLCKIDLTRVFEKGQSYVALSRASSLEGLQVIGYDPDKVQAHPKVVEWSKTLLDVSQVTLYPKVDCFEEEMAQAYEGVPYSAW